MSKKQEESQTPLYLDIRVPLITLRVILVAIVLFLISFGVLLPSSFLAFNYLYNQLIPTPTINLPLSKHVLNYDFDGIPPFVMIGANTVDPIYANQPTSQSNQEAFKEFDFDLNYDFTLQFNVHCKTGGTAYNSFESMMYKISIVSNQLVHQLNPYGTNPYISKRFKKWPISNNIHQLPNHQVLVSSMNTIVLNCDASQSQKTTHFKVGDLFSPIIESYLVPQVISRYSPYSPTEPLLQVKLFQDIKFNEYLNRENMQYFESGKFVILLEFNRADIIIDPHVSKLMIDVSWKGIKYYLFHYRILSYLLGITALWASSSFVLLATVGLVGWLDFIRMNSGAEGIEDDDDQIDDEENNDDNDDLIDEYTENPYGDGLNFDYEDSPFQDENDEQYIKKEEESFKQELPPEVVEATG